MSKDVSLLAIVMIVLTTLAGGLWYWNSQRDITANDNENITQTINKVNVTDGNSNVAKTNNTESFTLLKPATPTTVGEITTYQFAVGNTMSVMPASYKSMVLNETPVLETRDIMIGETPAQELTISSAKDGSEITIVQLSLNNTVYDFRGDDNFLQQLTNYIEFTN